jgi:uncharacterized membrane protein
MKHILAFVQVCVTISSSPQHFYMRIADQGGGLPFENADKIWKFSYSESHLRYQVEESGVFVVIVVVVVVGVVVAVGGVGVVVVCGS